MHYAVPPVTTSNMCSCMWLRYTVAFLAGSKVKASFSQSIFEADPSTKSQVVNNGIWSAVKANVGGSKFLITVVGGNTQSIVTIPCFTCRSNGHTVVEYMCTLFHSMLTPADNGCSSGTTSLCGCIYHCSQRAALCMERMGSSSGDNHH